MADIKKKHKFSFRKLVYNDRYLIACSIIAAVVIWVVTSMNLSPETTKKITVPVALILRIRLLSSWVLIITATVN